MDKKKILVLGGGISGMTTAIEAAEAGHEVILVEKQAYLGGRVAQTSLYFPKLCPPYCGLEINFRRIRNNSRIKILTSSTIFSISGKRGNYIVVVKTKPEFVNSNCTVCGKCTEVCPEERKNSFDYGLSTTKAIYHPHDMAFPAKFVIDEAECKGTLCNKCEDICPYGAINLNEKEIDIELFVDTIVIATGWKPFDASKIAHLSYGKHKDVVTNVEIERIIAPNGPTKGKLLRPSDKSSPKKVVFIQCAGSRDENYLPYCSAVCCSASLKQALILTDQFPEIQISIFYIDLRVSGRNEDFLNKVKEKSNISLVKGKAASVDFDLETGKLLVKAEDIFAGKIITEKADLVVLACGIVPEVPPITSLLINDYGFADTSRFEDGILSAGCVKKPQDVSSSVKDATGIALKAIQNNIKIQ